MENKPQAGQAGAQEDELGDMISEELAHGGAHYLSLGLDCNVSIMEYREQVSYLFSALRRDGWLISPPAFDPHN